MKDNRNRNDRDEMAASLREILRCKGMNRAYLRAVCRGALCNFRSGFVLIPNPRLKGGAS